MNYALSDVLSSCGERRRESTGRRDGRGQVGGRLARRTEEGQTSPRRQSRQALRDVRFHLLLCMSLVHLPHCVPVLVLYLPTIRLPHFNRGLKSCHRVGIGIGGSRRVRGSRTSPASPSQASFQVGEEGGGMLRFTAFRFILTWNRRSDGAV